MNSDRPDSLYSAIDSVSESLFFNRLISNSQRDAVANWIVGRQGLPDAYADMFAPTEKDTHGVCLFTGEAVRSRVGIAHILGEECCRVIALLDVRNRQVRNALDRAKSGLSQKIDQWETCRRSPGLYCCGTCSAAYWRNLAIGLLPRSEERLRLGLRGLRKLRTRDGRWRRFPFFYTCLVLTEIGPHLARDEMQYAAPYWQRNLNKLSTASGRVWKRRAAVGQRLLEMC